MSESRLIVDEDESANDVRMLTVICWIVGPTVIFAGWFLMAVIAGRQQDTPDRPATQYGLLLLFAFITSIPLVIVSLIGAGGSIVSDRLKTQSMLNTLAFVWSLVVFGIYFGLFGLIGTLSEGGFVVTSTTVAALIPTAFVALVVPALLFVFNRRRIQRAMRELAAGQAADAPAG